MISESVAIVVYDLRAPDQWQAAHRARGFWGKLYADMYPLSYDHIALVFRSAGERWRPFELPRLSWILDEDLEGRTA
jgi:hypothetical protein